MQDKNEKIVTTEQNESSTITSNKQRIEKQVWDELRKCYDPEIPVNIVDLGLIYEVRIEDENPDDINVFIKMTLTAPGCPLASFIASDVERKVQQVDGVKNVIVEIVFDPIWHPGMMSDSARMMLNLF